MPNYMVAAGNLNWVISRTCEGGQCIMVARKGDGVVVGNTNNPDGPAGEFTADEWRQFVAGVKLGDFDEII